MTAGWPSEGSEALLGPPLWALRLGQGHEEDLILFRVPSLTSELLFVPPGAPTVVPLLKALDKQRTLCSVVQNLFAQCSAWWHVL